MPLVAHSQLPAFERLKNAGDDVIDLQRARGQDIRELHVGFLNIMPDGAFEATERQFLSLIGSSSGIVQFYVHPFTVNIGQRDARIQSHIEQHYEEFDTLADTGLDALIITGTNSPSGTFDEAVFWPGLTRVLDFAKEQVTSTLCACLATHAAMDHIFGVKRAPLGKKCWGVFDHRPDLRGHPLVRKTNTRFDVPHSRFNDMSKRAMQEAGIKVLADSEEAGVHLAVSPDLFRFVFFQGHPEYDRESLLKEYKREVGAYLAGHRSSYPPMPEHYFSESGKRIVEAFRARANDIAEFPEAELLQCVDNTWGDTARVMFNHWLGLVYQLTAFDRASSYMPGVDSADPLRLRRIYEESER